MLASRQRLLLAYAPHSRQSHEGGSRQHYVWQNKKDTALGVKNPHGEMSGGFLQAKRTAPRLMLASRQRLLLAYAPHSWQSHEGGSTTHRSQTKKTGIKPVFLFGGDEWIRTTAPVIPTYTLSRGASSANLSTSPFQMYALSVMGQHTNRRFLVCYNIILDFLSFVKTFFTFIIYNYK